MTNQPKTPQSAASSRAEKLSILSALLGPEAMARLREAQPEQSKAKHEPTIEVDADRAAWHQNRLLERLRSKDIKQGDHTVDAPGRRSTSTAPNQEVSQFTAAQRASIQGLDTRLAAIAEFETLADEHPAVITRLIRSLSRTQRVAALKSLPGPVARVVVKRLR